MLNAHSRIAIPVESHFLSELIYRYPEDRDLTRSEIEQISQFVADHERFEHWKTTPAVLNRAIAATESQPLTLNGLIQLMYRLEVGNDKARWGDKTPGYERHFARLAAVFPKAKFVHIHRDGRDVSNSMCDRTWHGITEYQRARYWKDSIDTAFESAEKLGPDRCLSVGYETLVRSPKETLQRICEFVGEEFEPQMLQFNRDSQDNVVDQKIHSKLTRLPDPKTDLQRWKTESSSTRVLLFEALAGKSLSQSGYELSFGPTSRTLAKIAYWIPGMAMAKAHDAYLSTPSSWRIGLRQSGIVKKIRNMMYTRKNPTAEAKGA